MPGGTSHVHFIAALSQQSSRTARGRRRVRGAGLPLAMGFLQMLFDAWLGTTGYAVARRSGVVPFPRIEAVQHPIAQDVLRRFFQAGEASVDGIEAFSALVARQRFDRIPRPSGEDMRGAVQKGLSKAEGAIKRLRDRMR